VNPGANDYHLQAGSQAIGYGAALPQVTTDITGLPRPTTPSAGAYEGGQGPPAALPAPYNLHLEGQP